MSFCPCSNRNKNKMIKFTANFEINIQNYELYKQNWKELYENSLKLYCVLVSLKIWHFMSDCKTFPQLDPSYEPSVNWIEVTVFFTDMTHAVSEWVVQPPAVTGYPTRWSNESYWLHLFMQQPVSSGSLTNITSQ